MLKISKNQKNIIITLIITIGVFIVASWSISSISPRLISIPADFYGTSKEVNINEFTTYLNKTNLTIYLPSDLLDKYEMTAIYLKESPFIAIVVYSAESNKDYKTAELTIQIAPAPSIPTYNELSSNIKNPEFEKAYEINDWPVLVNERASSGGESSFIAKYGEYTLLTMIWIEGNNYFINSPTLITAEVIILVENMRNLED